MWVIGPDVPAGTLRYTPGLPIEWVLPEQLDSLAAPVVEFAAPWADAPLAHTATFARTTAGRWAIVVDAAGTAGLGPASRFAIIDGGRVAFAGDLQARSRFHPTPATTGTVTFVPGPQWVEVSPGIWRAS